MTCTGCQGRAAAGGLTGWVSNMRTASLLLGDVQSRSFYKYLTEVVGVPAASLGSGDYKSDVWATPRSLQAGAI